MTFLSNPSVDLDFVDPQEWPKGKLGNVQTLFLSKDGLIFGNIYITSRGSNAFSISNDIYDFDHHNGSNIKTHVRNFATFVGKNVAGSGTPYPIRFSGVNIVNHRTYTPEFPTGFKGF